MRAELVTEPGGSDRADEDFTCVSLPASGQGGFLVLLDGVTPPEGATGCVHSVPWYVSRLGGALNELSVSRPDLTLREILASSIRRTAELHRATCDLSHPRTPQATVVLARWDGARAEHLVLSDSVLLLVEQDGAVRAVLDDRIERLPLAAERAAVRDATEDGEREAARAAYVRAVESLRNAEGGFFTAAADPDVAARALTGETPLAGLHCLIALSDGATRWTERFHQGDWTALATLLRNRGPRALLTEVRRLERSPEGTAKRGKQHDDASVIVAEVGGGAR
ncbi:hypothetical protein ACQYWQ_21670 [Streptomyces sp. P6-2-1]|uniref:hypothetical protein n=1 Tax=unclassified Streptomyces TaxID=2593676 RepID=UPI003D35FD65